MSISNALTPDTHHPSTVNSRLKEIERRLAHDVPFGDWHHIINRVITFYIRGLRILSQRSESWDLNQIPVESTETLQLWKTLGDPAFRASVNASLHSFKSGTPYTDEDGSAVLQRVRDHLSRSDSIGLAELRDGDELRIGKPPITPNLWTDTKNETPARAKFRELFENEISTSVSSKPAVLRQPTKHMTEVLSKGYELLSVLLPALGPSLIAHVHTIAVIDTSDESLWNHSSRPDLCQNVSTHAIPGTIFLSPTPLRSPWHASEALLHEAAHKKLSDLVLTRHIFRHGFAAADSPTICAVWNRSLSWNSNEWSVDRAYFAFHFYVHMALYYAVVIEESDRLSERFGNHADIDPRAALQNASERAHYLGEELRSFSDTELGDDGREMLQWLTEILKDVSPRDRSVNLRSRLLMSRYVRETKSISSFFKNMPDWLWQSGSDEIHAEYDTWSGQRVLSHLIQSDLVSTYRIMTTVGEAEPPKLAFYDADRWSSLIRPNLPLTTMLKVFGAVRSHLAAVLSSLPQDAFQRTCTTRRTKTVSDLIQVAVDHAAWHVETLASRVSRGK